MDNHDSDDLKLSKRDYDEDDVQQAILNSQGSVLNEEILIIGQEIGVGSRDMKSGQSESIDILGIDSGLNACIVELKNKKLTRSNVKQVIKYAPYVDKFDVDRFEKEFQGDSTAFRNWLSDRSGEDTSLNTEQRLLLVGPDAERRTVRMIDWLQSQGAGLELIIFDDQKTEEGISLSMKHKMADLNKWPERDVSKWNKSKKKQKSII